MIAKITRGDDMAGLVRYLLGEGRHEEHTDQRVVGCSAGVDVPHGETLSGEARRALIAQLDGPRQAFGLEVKGGHVWHLSLTNRVDDAELSDETWGEVVRHVLAEAGFDTPDRAPCPWVAIRHGRSEGGNDHVHVAVSLVREDGTRASNWQDRVKVSRAAREMEQRYGLIVVEGRTAGATPSPGRPEIEASARRGRPEPERLKLARQVRAAAAASRTEAEFVRRLSRVGVMTRPRYAAGDRTRVTGYAVAMSPEGPDQSPVWFGGGRLAKDLSLPALRRQWEPTEDQGRSWRPGGEPAGARDTVTVDSEAWVTAAERCRRATEELGGMSPAEQERWAATAHDAAGAMAALADRFERDRPGTLSGLADDLARTAQHAPAARGGTGLEGLATVAAQAALKGSPGARAAAWLLLAAELARLGQTLAELHQARGETARAQALLGHHRSLMQATEAARRRVGREESKGSVPLGLRGSERHGFER